MIPMQLMLTIITFLPTVGALMLVAIPGKKAGLVKITAAVFTFAALVLSLILFIAYFGQNITLENITNFVKPLPWINIKIGSGTNLLNFKVDYFLGGDGLSLTMVLLNCFLSFLAVVGSFHITLRLKEYMVLILLLETGVSGVFCALDLILFFLFWEVELIPMYLLIGIWGGQRREYAALKFIIYTLIGSSIMLVGILLVYFSSGSVGPTGAQIFSASMPYLATHQLAAGAQLIPFLLIFFAFAIKIPMFPFHTWLPDAHTEAPTAVSVLLAGVLLKMGAYGLIRICISILPIAGHQFAPYLGALAAINILYGALVSMIQKDMKKMIAYSSVSHMGYVLLGVAGAMGASTVANLTIYKQIALTGAALQMFTHGTITGMLFFCVGVVYEKAHTREIAAFGGIAKQMPLTATMFTIAALASLGLPGLSGFVAEYLVFTGSYPVWPLYTILGVVGIVLTAGYLLWMVQRVFYSSLNKTWVAHPLTDATALEMFPLVALAAVILLVGIYPGVIVDVLKPSMVQIVNAAQNALAVVH